MLCVPFAAKHAVLLLHIAESQPNGILETRLWNLLNNLLPISSPRPAQSQMQRVIKRFRVSEKSFYDRKTLDLKISALA
jgi:hypothetical protein